MPRSLDCYHGTTEPGLPDLPSGSRWVEWTAGVRPTKYDRVMVAVSGTELSISGWSERTGVSPEVIYCRLHRSWWDPWIAVSAPNFTRAKKARPGKELHLQYQVWSRREVARDAWTRIPTEERRVIVTKIIIGDDMIQAAEAQRAEGNLTRVRQQTEEWVTEVCRRGTCEVEEVEEAVRQHLEKEGAKAYPALMDLHDGNTSVIAPKIRDLMLMALSHGDNLTIAHACVMADIAAAEVRYRLPGEDLTGI